VLALRNPPEELSGPDLDRVRKVIGRQRPDRLRFWIGARREIDDTILSSSLRMMLSGAIAVDDLLHVSCKPLHPWMSIGMVSKLAVET
jgi:hypothetical protein